MKYGSLLDKLLNKDYLSLSFNYMEENTLLLIFCNIPPLICYFKKESKLGILLSLMVV